MLVSSLLVMLLLQVGLATEAPMQGERLQKRLEAKVEEYTLSEDSFLQALTRVASEFEIPMGIEWVRSPGTIRKIQISWHDGTVHEILQSLVKSQPGYELQITNGVVHVFPRSARADRRSFLNLPIDKFQVENDYVQFASRRLQQRLRGVVTPPLAVKPGMGEAGSLATGMGDRRVTFKLGNVTVRDVLDKLSLAADFKIWVVTYPEKTALTATGFYRPLSLFTNAVSDDYQPVWHLLRWGYDPVLKDFRPDWKSRTATSSKE